MSEDRIGYFWVCIKDNYHDEWTIGERHSDGSWELLGTDELYDDKYFHEIGEKIEHE